MIPPRIGTLRVPPQQAAVQAQRLGVVPTRQQVRLSALVRHDPPRHGPQHFSRLRDELALAKRRGEPWGAKVPLIWVALEGDQRAHLLDGHHRATAAQAAGYEWVPALAVDADALSKLYQATGVSRVELVEHVMPLISSLAVHNQQFGRHREQAVAGPPVEQPTYQRVPDVTQRRVLTPMEVVARLCPHTPPIDVPAGREQATGMALIQRLNPYQSVVAVRNAVLVTLDQYPLPELTPDMAMTGPTVFTGGWWGNDLLRLVMAMTDPDRSKMHQAADHMHRIVARGNYPAGSVVANMLEAIIFADKYGGELEPATYTELRYVEGTSNKFWWYELHDRYLTRCWGRVESGPSVMSVPYSLARTARAEGEKLEHEKLRKGYAVHRTNQRSTRHATEAAWLVSRILSNGEHGRRNVAIQEDWRQWFRLTYCSLPFEGAETFELAAHVKPGGFAEANS